MRVPRALGRRLSASGPARSVLTLVGGTGAAMSLVIISSPILTRLYLPSDYGIYSVATSVLAILITVTCLRYDYAIPVPERDDVAANVLGLSVVSAVIVSVLSGAVLLAAGPWFLGLFGAASLAPYVGFLTIGQLGGGVVSALTNWAVRTRTFSEIAVNRLAQSLTLVAMQIGLGVAAFGAAGLLIGDVAGRVAGSTRLARAAWRAHRASLREVSRNGILEAAKRYRRFPVLSAPSAVLNTLAMQLPVLFLVALYGTDVGGQYAVADRLSSVPLTLVAGAVGQVFVGDAARLAHGRLDELRATFVITTKLLARLALVPAIVMAALAPVLAEPVLGPGWSRTGSFTAILVPVYYLTFVVGPTGETLNLLERQDLLLRREIARFGLLGGAVPLAWICGFPAIGAVVVLSAAGCLTYGIYGFLTWRAIAAARARA